jgi:hypothetical protein
MHQQKNRSNNPATYCNATQVFTYRASGKQSKSSAPATPGKCISLVTLRSRTATVGGSLTPSFVLVLSRLGSANPCCPGMLSVRMTVTAPSASAAGLQHGPSITLAPSEKATSKQVQCSSHLICSSVLSCRSSPNPVYHWAVYQQKGRPRNVRPLDKREDPPQRPTAGEFFCVIILRSRPTAPADESTPRFVPVEQALSQ